MSSYQRKAKQIRGFVAVWVGVSFLVAVATFVGIYIGTGELETATASQPIASQNTVLNTNETNVLVFSAPESLPVVDEAAPNDLEPAASITDDNDTIVLNSPSAADEGGEPVVASVAETAPEPIAAPPQQQDPTPLPTATIPPRQDRDFNLGVQVLPNFNNDENVMAGYMDAAANQLRLNWVKLQVRWEFAEPQPGVYDWERLGYDLFFDLAAQNNLKVLISVVSAPNWAREPGANLTQHGPPADNQALANFIGTLLSRYPGKIHAVEVWNEMNLAREWTSVRGLRATDYVAMVTTVANTVRFVDPNVIIVSGALSPTGVNDGVQAIDDFVYTDQLIAAGLLNVIDCYGAHHNGYNIGPRVPYDNVPNDPTAIFTGPFTNRHHSWSFYSTLTTYANKIRAAGSTVPLCITEFGWAVTEDLDLSQVGGMIQHFEFANDNTLTEQRDFLVEAIQMMDEEWDFVWLAFIWNLNFGPEAQWQIRPDQPFKDNIPYSLIRPNYTPALAWPYIANFDFRGRAAQR